VDKNNPEDRDGTIASQPGLVNEKPEKGSTETHAQNQYSENKDSYYKLIKVVDYKYNAKTQNGSLAVNISDCGLDARDWVIKNIGKICSSKEVLLEAGQEKNTGGHYRVLNESLKDGVLTIDFTAGFDSH
jgi:hypothetical protein